MRGRDAPPGHTTQRAHALPAWQLHVIEGLYYICPISLGWVAAASVFLDLQRFDTAAFVAGLVRRNAPARCAPDAPEMDQGHVAPRAQPSTWPALLMTGLLGFATNTASFLVITRCHPVGVIAHVRNAIALRRMPPSVWSSVCAALYP